MSSGDEPARLEDRIHTLPKRAVTFHSERFATNLRHSNLNNPTGHPGKIDCSFFCTGANLLK